MKKLVSLALAGVALLGLQAAAAADSLDRTGSLLVFPLFDNNPWAVFAVSVTNTNADNAPLPGSTTLLTGTVDVEFVYIDGENCLEFNRTRRLTPNDTITVTTNLDNPNQTRGYVYVFAKSPITGKAIKFDWLAGDSFQASPQDGVIIKRVGPMGMGFGATDIPPVVFKAASGLAAGANTDVDNDGVRDLNGNEYEQVSDRLVVPRFFAANGVVSHPELILIGLTGAQFTTVVNFLIYNDNEEVFSAQYTFDCWDRVSLAGVNGAFTQDFLLSTNHALNENAPLGFPFAVPLPSEYGWFRMDASIAFSTAATVSSPAFLAARVERFNGQAISAASLPYGEGMQSNGDLVQHGPFADNN